MNKSVLTVFNDQWIRLDDSLRDLRKKTAKLNVRERAEVAGSVPVYATSTALPTAGQVGRMAAVADTGKLMFDNGTVWREVTLV